MRLNRGVGNVLVLQGGRGLHLDQAPFVVDSSQYVYGNEGVVGEKARLENRRRTAVERLFRERDPLRELVMWEIDQRAAGEPLPG